MDEDIKYIETEPERVRSKAYDMVLNGNEIGRKHKDTTKNFKKPCLNV